MARITAKQAKEMNEAYAKVYQYLQEGRLKDDPRVKALKEQVNSSPPTINKPNNSFSNMINSVSKKTEYEELEPVIVTVPVLVKSGGGVVNVASTGVMTTVKGTLNVDEAVTLDSTLDVAGNVTSSGGSISGFDASLNDQTSTSYSLQSSDNGKVVTLNNANAITLTIPSGLGDGFNCLIVQKGAGQVTLSASGTTLINRQSHSKTAGQYAVVSIVNIGDENIIVGGDTGS